MLSSIQNLYNDEKKPFVLKFLCKKCSNLLYFFSKSRVKFNIIIYPLYLKFTKSYHN